MGGSGAAGFDPDPDTILHHGQILTVDAAFRVAQALAIKAGRIVAVGTDDDVLAATGRATRQIDLRGRTVVPGFVDAHAHLDREGLRHAYPTLQACRSIADVQAVVRRAAAERAPGAWLVLLPLGEPPFHIDPELTLAERRYPDRHDLDQAAAEHPVWIRAVWGRWNNQPPAIHVLNSAALRACGLHAGSPPPASSVELERDADGALTGRILEHHFIPLAEHTILRAAPRFDHALRVEALRHAMRLSLAVGTTSVYEGHGVAAEVLRVYKEVHDRGEHQIRAYLPISPPPWGSLAEAERQIVDWAQYASGPGFGDAWLKVGGIHLSYGGQPELTPLSQAAWPDTGWAGFGEQYLPPDEYRALCRLAARHRLRVNTIVDLALDEVLAIWEEVHAEYPIADLRWVLVHTVKLEPARDFPRLKRLGCVLTALPPSALYRAGLARVRAGSDGNQMFAYRDYAEAGLPWALTTDNTPYSLLFQLWVAVNRREREENRVIGPAQCLAVPQALRAMTQAGAHVCFEEDEKGSLEVGKLADLLVLSDDPLRIDADALKDLRVEVTMVHGQIVHDSGVLVPG